MLGLVITIAVAMTIFYVALKVVGHAIKWGQRKAQKASERVSGAAKNIHIDVPDIPHKKTIWRLTKASILVWLLFFMFLPVILTVAMFS